MSAHRRRVAGRSVIDFIITFNRITACSICSITIDVLSLSADVHRRGVCIVKRSIAGAKIIARVAIVAIDARCIFGKESILAHVFVDGLNLAVFALGWRLLLTVGGRHKYIVVRLVLIFDDGRIDGGRR